VPGSQPIFDGVANSARRRLRGAKGGHFAAWEQPELFSQEVRGPQITALVEAVQSVVETGRRGGTSSRSRRAKGRKLMIVKKRGLPATSAPNR
jgi:hypothetical protein